MLSRVRARLLTSTLIVGAASAALSLAGPDALIPFKDAAAAAATVGVAFVVDSGSGAPVVGCVRVPASDNGYASLAAFTGQEHLAAPIYNSSGLLCSIGGIPASGCGQQVGSGYDYWSYWHGATGTWVYSEVGAFAAVQPGDVEGWRYENPGHANPNDPPPASAPDYAAICTTASLPASSGPSASSPTTPSGSSGPSGRGTDSGSSTPTGTPAGPTVTTVTTAASAAHPTGTSGGRPNPATPGGVTGGSSTTTAPASTSAGRAAALGAPRAPVGHDGSGGSAAPLLIGGVLVAALAAAAGWRWRRRPNAP